MWCVRERHDSKSGTVNGMQRYLKKKIRQFIREEQELPIVRSFLDFLPPRTFDSSSMKSNRGMFIHWLTPKCITWQNNLVVFKARG
jgi:hypothetical protein